MYGLVPLWLGRRQDDLADEPGGCGTAYERLAGMFPASPNPPRLEQPVGRGGRSSSTR